MDVAKDEFPGPLGPGRTGTHETLAPSLPPLPVDIFFTGRIALTL